MADERKPLPDRGIVEALGFVLQAAEQAVASSEKAEAVGWIRIAQIWLERAADSYHEAFSALQDNVDRLRRTRLYECASRLRYARGAAASAPVSKGGAVWDLLTPVDALDKVAAEVDAMADRLEVP